MFVFSVLAGSSLVRADTLDRVAVLLSADSEAYRLIVDELAMGLAESPVEVSVSSVVDTERFVSEFDAERFDMVVTIGTRATLLVNRSELTVPTLAIYIPQRSYHTIFQQYPYRSRRSALFLDQPLSRQFALIRVMLPDVERVGVLISASDVQAAADLQQAAARAGVVAHIVAVTEGEDPVEKMKRVVDESDALLIVPEPGLIDPGRAKWLLYQAYRRGKPVVAYSQSFVTAGALAAIYSEPADIGAEAAEIIRHYLAGDGWPAEQGIYPQRYTAASNGFVARSLGVPLYDEHQLEGAIEGAMR